MAKLHYFLIMVLLISVSLGGSTASAALSDYQALTYVYGIWSMPYRLYVPPSYDPNKQYPLILFLHGAGSRGSNNTSQIYEAETLLSKIKLPQYEAILIAPQCPTDSWWFTGQTSMANAIVDLVKIQYNINPRQVFCTGLSMGGYGVWDVAARFGYNYTAFVPICGAEYTTSIAPDIVRYPVWAFHAANDTTVPVSATRNMIAAIRAAGGAPKYTEYATGGHGIWNTVYSTTAMYDWLFSYPVVGPQLAYEKADLGNGLFGYTFYIKNEDEKLLPYTLLLGFECINGSTIQQVKAFGAVEVHTQAHAELYDSLDPNYDRYQDSWVFSPFGENLSPGSDPFTGEYFNGLLFTEGKLLLSARTGTNSQYGDHVPVAYLVCDGGLRWQGRILRDGLNYDVVGQSEAEILALPGDYNDDGVVDLADYTVWADQFGQTGTGLAGDGNGDGLVDLADYTIWADNFGQTQP